MGAEAYGLVGFFTMLQAWFNLLDMGLTPTVARETARFRGGATDALSYRRLLRALEVIFFAVALLGGCAMLGFSELIADRWLNIQTLPLDQVRLALHLMAVGVALRWVSGLYRGCISGAERLVWLGGFNALVASLRFVGVLPVLIWIGDSPVMFFLYQLLISGIELIGLAVKAYTMFPAVPEGKFLGRSFNSLIKPIKPVLRYSLTIAFTSSVWILVSQTDKLVLSGILTLADYGYFTLAVLLASGIMTLCAPVTNPLTLRMVRLYAEGRKKEALRMYEIATSLITIFAGSVAIIMCLFPHQILMAWTGNKFAAGEGAPILALYSSGYFFCALGAFPGYIQQASGDLKYHLRGNLILLVVMVPVICAAAFFWGSMGAAIVWFSVNLIYLMFWTWFTHENVAPTLHKKWFVNCILKIILPGIFFGLVCKFSFEIDGSRFLSVVELFFVWLSVLVSMIPFLDFIRNGLLGKLSKGVK